MEQLKVIQVRKRKQTKEPVRQPDTYDKVVGESLLVCGRVFYCINVMLPDFRADIIYMKKVP